MKCYITDTCCKGKTEEKYMPFPTEDEYIDFIREKEREESNNE